MRRILFVALAVLFVCATAHAQINEGIGEANGTTFVFGYQSQGAGGSVNAGVHFPLTYAYAEGIGGDEVLDIPIKDWAEIHEWGEIEEIPDHIHIDGQRGFLMGIADPEASVSNPQVDAEGHFFGWQGQEQFNIAHAGTESVHAETYQGMSQMVLGGAYGRGFASAYASGGNAPQEDVFAGAITIGIGDPTNVGAAFTGLEIHGGIGLEAGAEAEDPGVLVWDEELGEQVYAVPPDYAFAASESWVGAYASYANTVNSTTFNSINFGWTASDMNLYATAVATGLSGTEENEMYAELWGIDTAAYSGGGIAIQADSDALGMVGGTGMYAEINNVYWTTEGDFEGGNGSMAGIDINQESYFFAAATNVTNTGYQTAFQEFSANQSISFQAKDGSVNLPAPPLEP